MSLCHPMTQGQDYEEDQICNVSNFERIPPSPVKASLTRRSGVVANGGLSQIWLHLSGDSNTCVLTPIQTNKQTNKQTSVQKLSREIAWDVKIQIQSVCMLPEKAIFPCQKNRKENCSITESRTEHSDLTRKIMGYYINVTAFFNKSQFCN